MIKKTSPALPQVHKFAAPLRQQVLDELRHAIISGRLAPGSRLIERELTTMMGVSRTVIRESLRQLESEGLIAIIPNRGPVVRELTLSEARELYSIRAVLEGLAAQLFVENADEPTLRRLGQALDVVVDAYKNGDAQLIIDTKNRFYGVLFEGAGSAALSTMLGSLYARIQRWRALGLSHPQRSAQRSREAVKGLKAMFTAIKRRDAAEAERAARDEARNASHEIIRLLSATK